MSVTTDEANELLRRMQSLRSTGNRDVQQLQHEMERVVDWREHVRARPTASAVAAAVVGFTVVRAVFAKRPQAPVQYVAAQTSQSLGQFPTSQSSASQPSPAARTAAGSALAFVGGMASTLARQWISEYLKKELKVGQHGFAKSPSHERPSSVS